MMRSASPVATPYPARWTRAIISGTPSLDESKSTVARSDDKLTTAVFTPSSFFKLCSTVATQFEQVMPVMGRISCLVSVIVFTFVFIIIHHLIDDQSLQL